MEDIVVFSETMEGEDWCVTDQLGFPTVRPQFE